MRKGTTEDFKEILGLPAEPTPLAAELLALGEKVRDKSATAGTSTPVDMWEEMSNDLLAMAVQAEELDSR